MKKFPSLFLRRWVAAIAGLLLVFVGTAAIAQSAGSPETRAAALLEKHAAMAPQLAQNAYRRPLFLESTEGGNKVSGSAYAVLDSSLSMVSTAFKSPNHWCDVLILHLNTKYCRADSDASPTTLKVDIGKKTPQSLDDAFELEFLYRLGSASPTFLAVQLSAPKGPLGTSDYRIELEAVPLPAGKTFMHLRYSYAYGVAGRLAMQTYLATLGSGKIGFTQIRDGTKFTYVGGMRGAVERNTMRYYLAMEAYLASLGQPLAQQVDSRLVHWFDATEEYSRQLHEVDRSSYMAMKKDEYQRQKTE
ncbi:MAG: hypothetical protein ABIR35_00660 [Polaromonas sp.]